MITCNQLSRLGNNFFQVSSLLGIASTLNYTPALNHRGLFFNLRYLCPNFEREILDGRLKIIEHDLPVSVQRNSEDNLIICNTSIPDNTSIDSYMQKEYYFLHIREYLLNLFELNPVELEKAHEIKDKYKFKFVLHYRGQDYISGMGMAISEAKWSGLIKFAETMVNTDEILIVTDDIKNASLIFNPSRYNIISSNINNVYCGETNEFSDFCLIYLAEYSYVLNSSFSFWARWLSKNITFVNEKLNFYKSTVFSIDDTMIL